MATAAHVRTTQAGAIVLSNPTGNSRITQAGAILLTSLGGTTRITQCGVIVITPQDAQHTRITQCGVILIVDDSQIPPPQNTYTCPIDASTGPFQLGGN